MLQLPLRPHIWQGAELWALGRLCSFDAADHVAGCHERVVDDEVADEHNEPAQTVERFAPPGFVSKVLALKGGVEGLFRTREVAGGLVDETFYVLLCRPGGAAGLCGSVVFRGTHAVHCVVDRGDEVSHCVFVGGDDDWDNDIRLEWEEVAVVSPWREE